MKNFVKTPVRLVRAPRQEVIDLLPRLSRPAQELANRIKTLGWETVLEDQLATLATYEWQQRSSGGHITEETSRRYAVQRECFLKGLGDWPLPDGIEGPVTLFHLATPGLGMEILHAWREALSDADETCSTVFGDAYRAMERMFRDFLCRPGQIADYGSLSRLGRGATRQTGTLLLTDRYGPITSPFPVSWRPGKKHRRREPVPRYNDEWLQVLDVLWNQQAAWLRTLPMRKAFPRLRAVAMLHLQSATGPRPSELCFVKQGHLLADRLRILHGGEKDDFPKNDHYDHYGNRLGRYRETPLHYVPEGLCKRLPAWVKILEASGRIALQSERALFPNGLGGKENCISYNRYRETFKEVLLGIVHEPSVKAILEPYLVKPVPTEDNWELRLTPHTIRAIYATHRMDLCDGPGAFRQLMEDLGWLTPSTILQYDRPRRVDTKRIQDGLFDALRREKS